MDDIAEILATLLLEDGHAGKTYELNGPEAISRPDIARLVSKATKDNVQATVDVTRLESAILDTFRDMNSSLADQVNINCS